jgi:NarL family two-component system response regulator LiaR
MEQAAIRVLIVDDHAIVRKGVKALLEEVENMDLIGEASNGKEAVDQTEKLNPDVILMDLEMPVMDGVEAISQITAQQEYARIIALTSFATDDKVFPAIKNGALGYILKDSDPDKLIEAIQQVYLGEPSLDPSIARKVLNEISRPTQPPASPDPLTEREIEVLRLVATGLSNQEIADKLTVAEVTVRTHVSHILSKLHLANRVQATLYALKEDLTSLENGEINQGIRPPRRDR